MPQDLIFPVEADGWVLSNPEYGRPLKYPPLYVKPLGHKKSAGQKTTTRSVVICHSSTAAPGWVLNTQRQWRVAIDARIRDWLKFQSLLSRWYQERGAMSSITEMSQCPAYQTIIGMGETAIPFILSQLRSEGEEPDQWFWALHAITDVHPGEECSGDYLKMAEWWLTWGAIEGYARW